MPGRIERLLRVSPTLGGLVLLCALAWLLPACAAKSSDTAGPAGSYWLDYDTVMETGARSDKPVMLYFRANWCYFCREMEQYVFPQPRVTQRLQNDVLPVRLDVGRHKRLAEIYNIKHLPTTLILDKHGREVLRSPGYMSEDRLLAAIEYVRDGRYHKEDFKTFLQGRM